MAKGRKRKTVPIAGYGDRRVLYQHSPNVIDQFGPEDLHTSYYPLPGIDFHNNEQLSRWVEKYGAAPDILFRQGLAAPPLGKNASGLRHYTAAFSGDPRMNLNLDVPIGSQTPDVQAALAKLGIRQSDLLDTTESIWEDAIKQHGAYTPGISGTGFNSPVDLATLIASGDPAGDVHRNTLAGVVLGRMQEAGIPAASRMGTGWGAGTGYGPQSVGKSPYKLLEDEAAAARADGDIVRAQEIENQLYEGTTPGRGVNVPAPTGGTREYKVFDPSAVSITRIASILAAMGVGGSVASADDRYGDSSSKFSMPPAPPEPTADERAGIGPNDTLTAKAYKRAGQYLSDKAGEVGKYLSDAAGRGAKYVSDRFAEDLTPEDMAAFHANPPREMRVFHQYVDEAMQMPVVRIQGKTVSPAEYLKAAEDSGAVSPLSVQNAIASIKGLPFDERDEAAVALRDGLLDQMRMNLPGRYEPGAIDTEFDAGATPEQAAEFDRKGALEGRYQLTPEGEQGYQSERAYNLFSTFQNGSHRPVGANNAGKALAHVGGVLLSATGATGEAAETNRLAGSRYNTPEGRLNEALYWYWKGEPDGTAGDSLSGAKYPSLSSTTFEGVTTKMSNADNFLPRYNSQLSERYLYNLDMPSANRAILDRMRDDFYRTTPRYPAGSDPKQVREIIRELKDLDTEARQYASVEYPSFVKKYAMSPEAFGGAPTDFTGKSVYPDKPLTEVRPTYLSPFGEMMANYPRDLMDAQTIGSLGLSGLTGGTSLIGSLVSENNLAKTATKTAATAGRKAANFVTDAVGETPANYAITEVNRPAGSTGFFDNPEYHPLVTNYRGEPVRADDPNYELYKPSAYQKRDDRLRRILEAGTTMYGLPPARMAPAQRYISPMAQ